MNITQRVYVCQTELPIELIHFTPPVEDLFYIFHRGCVELNGMANFYDLYKGFNCKLNIIFVQV